MTICLGLVYKGVHKFRNFYRDVLVDICKSQTIQTVIVQSNKRIQFIIFILSHIIIIKNIKVDQRGGHILRVSPLDPPVTLKAY